MDLGVSLWVLGLGLVGEDQIVCFPRVNALRGVE